jgi:uncharacterized protein YuzE
MKVTRNKKLDVAYVQLRKGSVAKTLKVRKDILVDLDRNGQVLGVEILSLSALAPALRVSSQSGRSEKTKIPPRKRAA